jgi:pimeloyl-ACP methyl ester carboxylesterase
MTSFFLAFFLACAPRYHAMDPLPPAQLAAPLPIQQISVDGTQLAYIDSGGPGMPVLLVHGLGSHMDFWHHQVPTLAAEHRVIALDLPGFGASSRTDAPYTPPWYADQISAFLSALQVERVQVVGHSLGGQVALTLALRHPHKVHSLVLAAPAGFERFTPGEAELIRHHWHERRALQTTEVGVRTAFTQLAFGRIDAHVEALIEARVRMGAHPDFAGTSVAVSRAIAGMLDHPVYDRLHTIDQPTLVLFGTADRMIPNPMLHGGRARAVATAGTAQMPQAELVMVPGAGHTVHHDAPEAFAAAVLPFLRQAAR